MTLKMNVLIVDDNRFVVKALETKLDWNALQIEHVFTAYNIKQAQKILLESDVQILISDIEMPQGNGLELLSWIRSENLEIQTIFLTNYADFNYAQKAIELQSFEYYLKPIEFDKLTNIIKKAIEKVEMIQHTKLALKGNDLWERNKDKLHQHFWHTYINNQKPFSESDLQNIIHQNHLSYNLKDNFLTVLISLFPYKLSSTNEIISYCKDNPEFEHIFQSIVKNALHTFNYLYESLLNYKDSKELYALIIKLPEDLSYHYSDIINACQSIITDTLEVLDCNAKCDVGMPCSLEAIHPMIESLNTMSQNILIGRNNIFELKEYIPINMEYKIPNLLLLEQYLHTHDPIAFIKKCQEYLTSMPINGYLIHNNVCNFRIDITQLIYSYLQKNDILAHKLFQGNDYELLFGQATRSLEDLINYITYIVNKSLSYIDFSTSQNSVVETICEYIDANLQNPITRNTLAEIVYLNPDYVTHIFKKEMGYSLSDYIIDKRIALAKKLLETTNLPISCISDKVGYDNYSHFTKLFKKKTSYTPLEYRKKR